MTAVFHEDYPRHEGPALPLWHASFPVLWKDTIRPPQDTRPITEVLAEIAARVPPEEQAKMPSDFCDQLDHYIYGAPKR